MTNQPDSTLQDLTYKPMMAVGAACLFSGLVTNYMVAVNLYGTFSLGQSLLKRVINPTD